MRMFGKIVAILTAACGFMAASAAGAEPWAIVRTCATSPCTIGVALPGSTRAGWSEVATFSGPQEAWAVACAFHFNDSQMFSPDIASGAIDCGTLAPAANGVIAISRESWSIFGNCNTRPCTIGVALPGYAEPDFSRIATYASAEAAWAKACELHYNDPNYTSPDIASGLIDCGLLAAGADALIGPWVFGRLDGPVLCNINLTDRTGGFGYVIESCHQNESFWALRGAELVFYRDDGFVTTIFRRERPDLWVGAYLGDPAAKIVHYISRGPVDSGSGECNAETYNPYGC